MKRLALVLLVLSACKENHPSMGAPDAHLTPYEHAEPGSGTPVTDSDAAVPDAAAHVETKAEKRARLAAEAQQAREEAAEAQRAAREQATADRAAELQAAREEGRHEGRVEAVALLRASFIEKGVDLDVSTRGIDDTILVLHAAKGCNAAMLSAFLKLQDPANPLSSAGFTSVECAGGVSVSLH